MARAQQPQRGGEAEEAATTTLATGTADSERTLIIQRGGAAGSSNSAANWPNHRPRTVGSTKRSAYFIDSASETSQAGSTPSTGSTHQRAALLSSSPPVPQRALFGTTSRTRGRRCLDGIRDTNDMGAHQSDGQWGRRVIVGSSTRRGAQSDINGGGEGGDGESLESKQKPAVFFGSIRFPASRVALW